MNEVDDQIKKKGVKKGLAFSSAALGEAHVAADLVCVQESDRKRARGIQKDRGQEREGKGGQVAPPPFTPTIPYRHIDTNLHAAAEALYEHNPTPIAKTALASCTAFSKSARQQGMWTVTDTRSVTATSWHPTCRLAS